MDVADIFLSPLMLLRCHIKPVTRPLYFLHSLLTHSLFSHFSRSTSTSTLSQTCQHSSRVRAIATLAHGTPLRYSLVQNPTHFQLPAFYSTMDSKVNETIVPSLDTPKYTEAKDGIEHLEQVSKPASGEIEHGEYLPAGVKWTAEDDHLSDWFIGSVDSGTTSSRFLIFNGKGTPIASHQIEFDNIYPQSGYARWSPPWSLKLTIPY